MNLLSIDSLTDQQIGGLLDAAELFTAGRGASDKLAGCLVFNLFYENSTRTLMSFEAAAARLGAVPVTLPVEQSSMKKGESLADTARTLNAMGPDALIMRHNGDGSVAQVAELMDCPVVNAGDGTNEHPTQALLDALTLRQHFGRIEGLTVAICGDIRHSRVARSNRKLLGRLGATVRLAGPPSLLPDDLLGASTIDEAVRGADVVMMLRVQRERLDEELGDSPGEYLASYGLTAERLASAAPHAVVLHPGPMNRGVEIADEVADHPRSLILRQVANGVAMRMAVLDLLLSA
jgi:aspartate carbamoyltransferase catalytic subunit